MSTEQKTALTFDFEEIESLVGELYDESRGQEDARLTITKDGCLVLVCIEKPTTSVKVYYAKADRSLYEKMDAYYVEILDKDTATGNDFWDKWYCVTEALKDNLLTEDSFS